MKKLNRWFFLIALSGGLLPLASARAATFTVSTMGDTGDGVCNVHCSLREAITAANAAPGPDEDVIVFAPNVRGTIQLQSSLPEVRGSVSVQGPGAKNLTIRGGGTLKPYRILRTVARNVSISDLTISNGHQSVTSSNITGGSAILNSWNLSLSRVHLQNNSSNGVGGAICNDGELTMSRCTMSGNSTTDRGGAIWTAYGLTVSNCTFYGNFATLGAGAIRVFGGTAVLSQNTFASNFCNGPQSRGGAIETWDYERARITLNGNLFSGNRAPTLPDLAGLFLSSSYNLISRGEGALGITNGVNGDQVGSVAAPLNARVGPLADNGGPTQTCALLSGSPAIDAGNPDYAPPAGETEGEASEDYDQRGPGFPRLRNRRIDIGAYETQPALFLSINDATVAEGNDAEDGNSALFTISLSSPAEQAVSVNVRIVNGTALAPGDYQNDYIGAGTVLNFAPGEQSKSLSVPIKGDARDEADETFYVLLSAPVNATIQRGRGIGTIVDDDAPPTITIEDVSIAEGNPIDGTPGQRVAVFRLHLSAPSDKVVTVGYQTAEASGTPATVPNTYPATPGDDYSAVTSTTLAFPTGQTVALARVLIRGDALNEPNESFVVNLSNPLNATLGDSQAVGVILNDDAPPALTISDAQSSEGNVTPPTPPVTPTAAPPAKTRLMPPYVGDVQTLTFTVTLSKPSGQVVTVNYATADGIARSSSDYSARNGQITFLPGDPLTQIISIPINGDTQVEADETLFVLLKGAVNASIARGRGTGTITNDDVSG